MGNIRQQGQQRSESVLTAALRESRARQERTRRVFAMTRQERVAAMWAGDLTFGECLAWAARHPDEVPLVNNEFAFIALAEG